MKCNRFPMWQFHHLLHSVYVFDVNRFVGTSQTHISATQSMVRNSHTIYFQLVQVQLVSVLSVAHRVVIHSSKKKCLHTISHQQILDSEFIHIFLATANSFIFRAINHCLTKIRMKKYDLGVRTHNAHPRWYSKTINRFNQSMDGSINSSMQKKCSIGTSTLRRLFLLILLINFQREKIVYIFKKNLVNN